VQLAVSLEVASKAGLDTRGLSMQATEIRGSTQPVNVFLVESAKDLLSRFGVHPGPDATKAQAYGAEPN
jgi:hypothetical protein